MERKKSIEISEQEKHLEKFLSDLMPHFQHYSHDKGKDLISKEKENCKFLSPVWNEFLNLMSAILLTEKSYNSFNYLIPKGFLRWDTSLKSSLESCKNDLSIIKEYHKVDESDRITIHLSSHIIYFIEARMSMVDFYEKLSSLGPLKVVNYVSILQDLTIIADKYNNKFHHPFLSALESIFNYEIETLTTLIKVHIEIQSWKFLEALVLLNEASEKITLWENWINKENTWSGFGSSFHRNQTPILLQWMNKIKNALMVKFTFYFHDVLSHQTTMTEMRVLVSKLTLDYLQSIQQFQKKTEASSISIVLDTFGMDFNGHGYQFPQKDTEQPEGVNKFPAVAVFINKPPHQWSSVVMLLSSIKDYDMSSRDIFSFYDGQMKTTYFFGRIEPKMTLLITFDFQKSDKDSSVLSFINELCQALRCNKAFTSLKTGSK